MAIEKEYELAAMALANVRPGITAKALKIALEAKRESRDEGDRYISREEAAHMLRVSHDTIDRLRIRGALLSKKISGAGHVSRRTPVAISLSSVRKFMGEL